MKADKFLFKIISDACQSVINIKVCSQERTVIKIEKCMNFLQ